MIWEIIEALAIAAEVYMASRFLILYFGFRTHEFRKIKWISFYTILFFIDYSCTVFNYSTTQITASILVCITFTVIYLNGKLLEKIMISIISYILFAVVCLPVLALFTMITGDRTNELTFAQNAERIIILFITRILYFILSQAILNYRRKNMFRFKMIEWALILLTSSITIAMHILLYELMLESDYFEIIFMLITMLMVGLNVLVYILVHRLSVGNKREIERNLLMLQIKQNKNDMQHLINQYSETQKIRHDMKNYVSCLSTLMQEKNYEKAEEYLGSFTEKKLGYLKSYIHSSNQVVNAIVNSKFSMAEKSGISVECIITCRIPENLEFDLSIILSNLIDNAIEGCTPGIEPLEIVLDISEKQGYINITLKNTVAESILQNNPDLVTNKKDKKLHGIGLKSVRELVRQHDGLLDFYESDNMFIVNAMLKNV